MLILPADLTGRVIGAAIEVHRHTGPGLLESSYQHCLAHEFALLELPFRDQVPIPVRYKGVDVDCRYRADFVVDDRLLVEIKSVEHVPPIVEAQMITYLRLLGLQQGLLINFNVSRLTDGVRRFVNTRRPRLAFEGPLAAP